MVQKGVKLDLPDALQHRAAAILRTREHEWTHFRQHVSTPIGLFIYRLCATREDATRAYYQACSSMSPASRPSFEQLYRTAALNDPTSAPIILWKIADTIEGILWCKTCPLGILTAMWSVIIKLMNFDMLVGGAPESRSSLVSHRAPSDLAVPHGHVTVQDLTEGFASYREARELILHFGLKRALELLGPLPSGDNGRAGRYIEAHLGIPFYHPLSGALQEVAMLCFVDPFISRDSEPLDWDEIHPGLCFERAVDVIANGPAQPANSRHIYEMVLDAYGLTHSRHRQSLLSKVTSLSGVCPRAWTPLDQRDGVAVDEPVNSGTFQLSLFRAGFKLRNDVPDIFFNPQGYFPPSWNRFVDELMPPLLVHPEGVSFPRANDDRSLAVNLTLLLHAFGASISDDIARYGLLRETITLYRHVNAKHPGLLLEDRLTTMLKAVLANAYDPQVDRFN